MTSARQQARTLTFEVAIMVVAGFIPAIVMGLLGWTPLLAVRHRSHSGHCAARKCGIDSG